MKITMQQRKA